MLDLYAGNPKKLFPDRTNSELTFQLSDHLPLWIQIHANTDGQKLEQLIRG